MKSKITTSKLKIGIEAIAFDMPDHYIEMKDLAGARRVEPDKYTIGIGQTQMAVASPCEDTVVLAAEAGLRLLNDYQIDTASIALLIVGTETGVDHSKPVSSYVHQMLGLSTACRVFEVKHACYGAMAGLSMAVNYILTGKARGKKALVIASDIARYGKNTPGEPTQGAGAVAMLVSDQPRLLEIDHEHEGFYASQVMDFWRPLYSKEAFADGHYSIECYLKALEGAYGMYKESVMKARGGSILFSKAQTDFASRYAACLYHVPFVKMARKAHQRLLETDLGERFGKNSELLESSAKDFEQRVAPWLHLNASIGNIYTGALFLSLYYLLENGAEKLNGQPISLFSYGSGSGAEFMGATVADKAAKAFKGFHSSVRLNTRKKLNIPDYEHLLDSCSLMDSNHTIVSNPQQWNLNRRILYLGTKDHQRIYSMDEKILILKRSL